MKKAILLLILIFSTSCSSDTDEPLTKQTGKFLTEKWLEVIEWANESLSGSWEEIAKALTETTGEILVGISQWAGNIINEKGNKIEENLGLNSLFTTSIWETNSTNAKVITDKWNLDIELIDVIKDYDKWIIKTSINFLEDWIFKLTTKIYNDVDCKIHLWEAYATLISDKTGIEDIDFAFGNPEPIKTSKCIKIVIEKI